VPPPGLPLPPPPPTSPGGQPLASFGDRLLAVLIDSAILAGVGLVLAIPAVIIFVVAVVPDLGDAGYASDGTAATPAFLSVLLPFLLMEVMLIAVLVGVQYVYQVELSRRTGQTVGKRVMRIRIVPLDPTRQLTRGILARRFVAQLGCSMLPSAHAWQKTPETAPGGCGVVVGVQDGGGVFGGLPGQLRQQTGVDVGGEINGKSSLPATATTATLIAPSFSLPLPPS